MKNKFITIIAVLALSLSLVFAVACTEQAEQQTEPETTEETTGMPAMQPADHEGRFEASGPEICYTCHGNGDNGNPNVPNAVAIPEDHYVDGSYDTKELDPDRNQCITCHPVTNG